MKFLEEWLPDIFMAIGVCLLFYGLYAVFPPSAFIVIGCLLVYMGWPKPKKVK